MSCILQYQACECDCVVTSLVNALKCLYSRKDIPPEVLKQIYTFGLDSVGQARDPKCPGTTWPAAQMLTDWLSRYRSEEHPDFRLKASYEACPKTVPFPKPSRNGRKAVLLLHLLRGGTSHYVLVLRADKSAVDVFDPYGPITPPVLRHTPVTLLEPDGPLSPNLRIPMKHLYRTAGNWTLGPQGEREYILLEQK